MRASSHILGVMLVLVLCRSALASGAIDGSISRLKITRDPRLQDRLEVVLQGRPLGVFLEEVSRLTGVDLEFASDVGDQKIILVGHRGTIWQVLGLIAEHFDLTWTNRPPGPSIAVEGPAYRLRQDRQRARQAGDLRQQAARLRENEMRERLELHLKALNASPVAIKTLARQDPFVRDVALYPSLRARLQLAARLNPEQRAALVRGLTFVSAPLRDLPRDVQKLVEVAAGSTTLTTAYQGDLRYTLGVASEDGSRQLWFRLLDPMGRQVGSAGTLIPFDPSRKLSGQPVPRRATESASRPPDPALQRDVELPDGQGRPVEVTAGLPALLEAVSRATGFDVLSDHYSDPRLRFDPEPIGKRPVWQVLNIVAEQFELRWKRQGSFLLFRHRYWFEEEAGEIPERPLRPWFSKVEPTERVSVDELFRVLTALTEPQIEALPQQFRTVRWPLPLTLPRFLGSLAPDQREHLLAGKELRFGNLSTLQRGLILHMLPRIGFDRRPTPQAGDLRIELRASEDSLEGIVRMGNLVTRRRIALPMKQIAPEPPVVRLYRSLDKERQ